MPDITQIKIGDVVYDIVDDKAYRAPDGGIPKTDLNEDLQSELNSFVKSNDFFIIDCGDSSNDS